MISAINKFHELEQGVLGIVRAADVYALHVMAKLRNQDVNMDVVNSILSGGNISWLNLVGSAYTEKELKQLGEEGHFTAIGQQIIVAAHTALESYLKWKFSEYYKHFTLGAKNEWVVEESITKLIKNLRCLDDFKKTYKEFFRIHIPSFEINYYSSDGCIFRPENSWKALEDIYEMRNDIVHKGIAVKYKVSSLMDSWYPFDFVQNWVSAFDANFDSYIYHNIETELYREHKKRAISSGVLF